MIRSLVSLIKLLNKVTIEYKDDVLSVTFKGNNLVITNDTVKIELAGDYRLNTPNGYVMTNCSDSFQPSEHIYESRKTSEEIPASCSNTSSQQQNV